ncbi:MAG: hypothetical protein KIG22_02530 [Oxalobacter sp.]|nr:hypothetical protein [Oxalobacter sp.]
MIDYTTWPVVGKGMERTCYLNPDNPSRLVKISLAGNTRQTQREIRYFRFLLDRGVPFDHIPKFYGEIHGDGFIGFEQEYVRDFPCQKTGNAPAISLRQYPSSALSQEQIQELQVALDALKAYLLCYNIIPNDLGADNIVVKRMPSGIRLVLIDGFGSTELIPASIFIRFIGNRKIIRKWEKFLRRTRERFPKINIR